MSFSEIPADTDTERILKALDNLSARLDSFAAAINGLGENQQWLIDQAQGIFKMFSSPAFLGQLSGMMGQMPPQQEAVTNGG